jgi:hypothetical protein
MQSDSLKTLAFSCALCALAACSQGAAPAHSSAAATPASTPTEQSSGDTGGKALGNPCDVITATDVAGIFTTPAARRIDDVGKDKCIFDTDSGAKLSIVTSKDDDRKSGWDLYRKMMKPLAGLGDEALQDPAGATVFVAKGDIDCMIELEGIGDSSAEATIAPDRGEALARKLGALCTKLFAAR